MTKFAVRFAFFVNALAAGLYAAAAYDFINRPETPSELYHLFIGHTSASDTCPFIEPRSSPTPSPTLFPFEADYEIYSVLLAEERYRAPHFVIVGEAWAYPSSKELDSHLPRGYYGLVADYEVRNADSLPLKNHFRPDVPIALIGYREHLELARDRQLFGRRYPQAGGLISFSRVGFDYRHEKALVKVSFIGRQHRSEQTFFVLHHENGEWRIKERHEIRRETIAPPA